MERTALKFRTAAQADIVLPKEFGGLRELAYNLWWTWSPRARQLFSSIDHKIWTAYRNPVELLINMDSRHWEPLLENGQLLATNKSLLREFHDYLLPVEDTWFARNFPDYRGGPFAYFSTEFGFHESLHGYSGGLGVLSGDHCKSASDLGLPFIGVGLLYKNGYFEQEIEPDGRQQHFYPAYDFSRLPILMVLGDDGRQLTVSVDFPGRSVYAQVWLAQVGRVPVLFLDTDTPKNDPADRPITGQLYVIGREMRICQEIILGRGGVRVLQALGIEPSCWHMNEGHCAFLTLERARGYIQRGLSFTEAAKEVAKNSAFTTHTPVPAGNEAFDIELVRKYFKHCCEDLNVDLDKLVELGLSYPGHGRQPFSMTVLAIKMSSYWNGVSQLHAKVSNDMWRHIYKDLPASETPIAAVTNGVHTQTWLGIHVSNLFDKYLTPAWRDNLLDELFWKRGVANIPDREFWEVHNLQKEVLIRFARKKMRAQLARHGSSPDELRAVDELLNLDSLTIGFARRFATYKRADLLFHDFDRLRAILKNTARPVQILFAGKAHPADKPGQELVRRIWEVSRDSDLRGHIVFLENYNMRMARMLVEGADVWLNTPRRPLEACGTSGMKASVNGGINCSIADGWWCEGANHANGWTIGNGQQYENPELQDYQDSQSLYDLLENKITPLYYQRDANGLPIEWIKIMKNSLASIVPRFSAARMVREYVEQAYLPAAKRGGAITTTTEQSW
jgi:starch phosphorylase